MNDHNKRLLLYTTVAVVAAILGLLWLISREISREPWHPAPVVRTDEEAIARAKTFLLVAGISTSKFDTGKLRSLSTGRIKDVKVWRVAWPAYDGLEETNDLVVLVFENGRFYYDQMTEPNAGFYIEGLMSNFTTGRFELSQAPNHTSESIRRPADGSPKPSM